MKTKMTPGPWKCIIKRCPNGILNGRPYIYAPNGPDSYVTVADLDSKELDDEWLAKARRGEKDESLEANSRAIAAVPELLEFVESCARSGCLQQRVGEKCICFACKASRLLVKAGIE